MTQTLTTTDQWLAEFEEALAAGRRRPGGRAVRQPQLLARPRRVHLEHHDGRGTATASPTCSTATLATTDADAASATTEEPAEADGVDRRPGSRSRPRSAAATGLLRLQRRQGLDAADHADELKGHEEPAPRPPPEGRRARRQPGPRHLAGAARAARPTSSATRPSPYVLIIGGGQGGIALGARLRQLGVPTIIVDKHARPGDQWRSRYKSLCLHDPVWYDHLPYLKFPDELAGLLAQGQDRRLARDRTRGSWSSTTGAAPTAKQRHATTRRPGSGRSTVDRDGPGGRAAPQAARARHRHVRQAERARRSPGRTSSAATSTTPPQHPGPDALPGKRVRRRSAPTTRPTTSAARCGRTAPT